MGENIKNSTLIIIGNDGAYNSALVDNVL